MTGIWLGIFAVGVGLAPLSCAVPPAAPAAAPASGHAAQAAKPPGAKLWAASKAGPDSANNVASAVAFAPGGTAVFVTGAFGRSPLTTTYEDYGTVGYSTTTGRQLWARRYDGAGGIDIANAIAVSPDARTVFVTGESQGADSYYDYATVAYAAASGAPLWVSRYDGGGAANKDNVARAIGVSPDGSTVFVTGQGTGKTPIWDYATVAYNAATGRQVWVSTYNSGAKSVDIANALAVSPDGRTVFVTGSVDSRKLSSIAYGTIAYDARTGARRWVRLFAGQGGSSGSTANAIRVSPDGRTVFVTGTSGSEFDTIAYDTASGATRWIRRLRGLSQNVATAIAVSPGGASVYVTGYAATTVTYRAPDIVTLSYDARTGAQRWARRYHANGPCRNVPTSVAVGPDGRTVFVSGFSTITNPQGIKPCDAGLDTLAYRASTGALLWLRRTRGIEAWGGALAVSRATDRVVSTGAIVLASRHSAQYETVAYRG